MCMLLTVIHNVAHIFGKCHNVPPNVFFYILKRLCSQHVLWSSLRSTEISTNIIK